MEHTAAFLCPLCLNQGALRATSDQKNGRTAEQPAELKWRHSRKVIESQATLLAAEAPQRPVALPDVNQYPGMLMRSGNLFTSVNIPGNEGC